VPCSVGIPITNLTFKDIKARHGGSGLKLQDWRGRGRKTARRGCPPSLGTSICISENTNTSNVTQAEQYKLLYLVELNGKGGLFYVLVL
jgi:hypothetical protein